MKNAYTLVTFFSGVSFFLLIKQSWETWLVILARCRDFKITWRPMEKKVLNNFYPSLQPGKCINFIFLRIILFFKLYINGFWCYIIDFCQIWTLPNHPIANTSLQEPPCYQLTAKEKLFNCFGGWWGVLNYRITYKTVHSQ